MDVYENEDEPGSPVCAPFKHRGRPSAAGRLVLDGLIAPDAYDRLFEAELGSWREVLSMDEASLDAELGATEAAAVDAAALSSLLEPQEIRPSGAPSLRVVEADAPTPVPAPYSCHYRLRLAGIRDGLVASFHEIQEELKSIKRLLMAADECFLPDVFKKLPDYLVDGRLLIVEHIEAGKITIEGCVAYEQQDLLCPDDGTDGLFRRRVNVISLLAVRESENRAMLAVRLCLEAQLRGTVRAAEQSDGLTCIGTLGVILEMNGRALTWASRLGDRVKIVGSKARIAKYDGVLSAFRDQFPEPRDNEGRPIPHRFVLANRMQLIEAAQRHMVGVVPYELRQDEPNLRIDYDIDDPCSPHILKAATELVAGDPDALDRFGLIGEREATIWGPGPTAAMGLPLVSSRSVRCNSSSYAAA